ncbi:hypothetical protein WA026_022282 [Henosepilachna vigintioctopunctata]|uniref:LAGLIDADG homing endonuclease n=1 Tax=Henosepilachna vigintioctopunctata TaxID=420089 RepID=A0AAW1VJ89_9CUCU
MNLGDYKVAETFSRVDGCYGGVALVVRNGDFNIDLLKANRERGNLVELSNHMDYSRCLMKQVGIQTLPPHAEIMFFRHLPKYLPLNNIDPGFSDHLTQKLIFPIDSPVENGERYVVQYAINEANKYVFKEMLNAAGWSTVLTNRADGSYENFHNKFQKYFIESFPKIRAKHRGNVEIISEKTKSHRSCSYHS